MKRKLTDSQLINRLDALLEERNESIRRALVLSALWGGAVLVLWLLASATSKPSALLWGVSWGLVQLGLVGHGLISVWGVDRRARDVIGQSETFARIQKHMQ
jgi:hypothetical protein